MLKNKTICGEYMELEKLNLKEHFFLLIATAYYTYFRQVLLTRAETNEQYFKTKLCTYFLNILKYFWITIRFVVSEKNIPKKL